MKKLSSLLLALLIAMTVFSAAIPASALSSKEFEGKTYFGVTQKSDLDAAAAKVLSQRGSSINVWFRNNERNWDSDYSNNVVNFTGYNTKGVFNYTQFSVSTVWVSVARYTEENGAPESYGTLEATYLDTADELRKADAKIDAKLASLSSLSKKDKLLAIADYVCNSTSYGTQKLPDGGYDDINGVYDVLFGVRTNTVCTSYALTFQRFMERAGIPCFILSNIAHAWNMVELDGVWYGIDCTADNGSQIDRPHFLMGSSTMKQYSTAQLDPLKIFGRNHTIAATNYGIGSNPPVSTDKPTAPSKPAASEPTSSVTETESAPASVPSSEAKSPVTVTDKDLSIRIDAEDGVLPAGTAIKAEAVSEGEVFTRVQEALKDVSDKFSVYDIALISGEAKIQPNGKVSVTLPIPADYDKNSLAVYYVAGDGAKTELDSKVDGDSVTFETDHFSTYVLAEKTAEKPAGHLGLILGIVGAVAVVGIGVTVYFVKFRKKSEA